MTQPPDGPPPPAAPTEMRSRPADVVAQTPVMKTPAPDAAAGSPAPGGRPGTPPADTVALGTERAARVADVAADAATPRVMTTDSIMPTCMIYVMFAGLALLVGMMVFWYLTTGLNSVHF